MELKSGISKFHLTMHCYYCHIEAGELVLKEHEAARWLAETEIDSVDWLPADKLVVGKIKIHLNKKKQYNGHNRTGISTKEIQPR